MELDPAEMTSVVNRLRRAQGQLAAVTRMLEEGRACPEVITQLAAVSKAVDRAGFAIIAARMEKCLVEPGGEAERKRLEKLFLSFA